MSPVSTHRRSSTRSGDGVRTRGPALCRWSGAIGGCATTATDRRRRRPGVLRGDDQRPVLAVALGARALVTDLDDRRADVRRGRRAVPAARAPEPETRADRDVDGARAARAARSPRADRTTAGRAASARPAALLAARAAAVGVRRTIRAFSTRDANRLGVRRYWRGPTWINSAWLLWLGLTRLGYAEPAAELASRDRTERSRSHGLARVLRPASRGAGDGRGRLRLVLARAGADRLRSAGAAQLPGVIVWGYAAASSVASPASPALPGRMRGSSARKAPTSSGSNWRPCSAAM